MRDDVRLTVDGQSVAVPEGASVAAAIAISGRSAIRRSVSGEPRGAVCGMGICFECRATVDGRPHRRTCTLTARDGMEVVTDGGGSDV